MADVKQCGKIAHGKNCTEPVVETLTVPMPADNLYGWRKKDGAIDGNPVGPSWMPKLAEVDTCAKPREELRRRYGLAVSAVEKADKKGEK